MVTSRFGSKIRVVFASSPGYGSMSPTLQFVIKMLALITNNSGQRMRIAALNRELEETNLRPLKAELVACWEDISLARRGCSELAVILILLVEVLSRGLKFCQVAEIEAGH